MSDTNDLMDFISASLGTTVDEICQLLLDCNFGLADTELAMFIVALLNAMGREGRGDRPLEVVLILALGEYGGTAERAEIASCDGDLERCRVTICLVSQDWVSKGTIG